MKQRLELSIVLAAIAAVITLSVAPVGAGGDDPRTDRRSTARNGASRPGAVRTTPSTLGARTTSIVGSAWYADNSRIKFANLRLRDVVGGRSRR